MADKRLSKNFLLSEFTATSYTDLAQANKEDGAKYEGVLRRLCIEIMQKIRNVWGPVRITSGYRSAALNKRVGSTPASQHRKGEACDFVLEKVQTDEEKKAFMDWCVDQRDCGLMNWHQLLQEPECFHVALATGSNDGEVGTWKKKKSATGQWERIKNTVKRATPKKVKSKLKRKK